MHKVFLWMLLTILVLGACKPQSKQESTPLAEVNGDVLSLEGFRSNYSDEEWNSLTPEEKKQEIENWVNVTLLAQAAEERNLHEEKAVRQRIDYATKKIKANALIARRLASVTIGEEELFNYYRLHLSEFQSKLPEYDVQRILVRNEGAARILLQRLKDGYEFEVAVAEQSQEMLRDKQGRMGFVNAAGEDSLFWRAAHALMPNEPGIAGVNGAVYILRHTAQRDSNQDADFTQYRDQIRQILLQDKQRQVYEDLLREFKMQDNDIYYY